MRNNRSNTRGVRASTLSVCLLATACNWNAFEPYAEHAPIRVHKTPNGYGSPLYGSRLATGQITRDQQTASSIFVSAGAKTPVSIVRAYQNDAVSESGALLRCQDDNECMGGSDIGATLIPFPTWARGTDKQLDNCVFAPANSIYPWAEDDPRLGGEGFVLCETDKTVHFAMGEPLVDARGPSGTLLFSGFGLPEAHPLGLLIYGAFALDNKNGERRGGGVYVQEDFADDSAPLAVPVPLLDPSTGEPFASADDAADLGRQVAGVVDADGVLLLAVSQPSKQRVLVASWDNALPGKPIEKVRLRACIESPDAELRGFGERLVVGDVTGDGKAELFIGVDPVAGAELGKQALYMYQGDGLPGEVTGDRCPNWESDAVAIACADQDGVRCEGSAFGAALALGDVDGDQKGDLIVGAPNASVDGASGAGALFLIPGADSGLAPERAAVLTSGGRSGEHLGTSVAALHTRGRDEPVASATGSGKLYVFMCSPLEEGYGVSSLCLPR
jgi:hypothetical protein